MLSHWYGVRHSLWRSVLLYIEHPARQRDRAIDLCSQGERVLIDGDVDQDIQLFTESLEIYPTAEAFTFRGWAYSFEGRLDDAIR